MDLILFCVFTALSLILIILGFARPEHTELPLIGFFFLFLLALLIINQDIQYKVGTQTNTTYSYNVDASIDYTTETSLDVYDTFSAGGSYSHSFGYWLAIASAVGFVGVLLGLRKEKW